MQIIRFALGIRLAPNAGDSCAQGADSLLSRLFYEVPKKRFAGMKLYIGRCSLFDGDDPNIITLVAMGQGIKKTKALYNAIMKSRAAVSYLAEQRPVILSNAIARLEGLTYCGEFNKKGELEGGEACPENASLPASDQ